MDLAAALIVARLVHFLATMALFGAALFPFYALANAAGGRAAHGLAGGRRSWLIAAAMLALASAGAWVLCMVAMLAGDGTGMPGAHDFKVVLLDTGFGRAWIFRLIVACLALAATFLAPSGALTAGLSALLLASQAWIGHAAMGEGLAGGLRLAIQATHLLAAGAWLGGLLPLGALLAAARHDAQGPTAAAARTALIRFSDMGVIAVGLIVLSGIANVGFMLHALDAFGTTTYGRVLALKLALFLGLVAVATVNRYRLMPRIARQPEPDAPLLARIGRNVVVEQALGLLVLAAVSVLGTLPPGQ